LKLNVSLERNAAGESRIIDFENNFFFFEIIKRRKIPYISKLQKKVYYAAISRVTLDISLP